MDEARIRELQTMIDDGRADCSKAFGHVKRLDAQLFAAREYASRIEERLHSAIGAFVDACNALGKELHEDPDNPRIRELMARISTGITKFEIEHTGLKGVEEGLAMLFDIILDQDSRLCEKLIADLDRMQMGMGDAIAQLKRDFKELKKELHMEEEK